MVKVVKYLLCVFGHNKKKRDTLQGLILITRAALGCVEGLVDSSCLSLSPIDTIPYNFMTGCLLSIPVDFYSAYHHKTYTWLPPALSFDF